MQVKNSIVKYLLPNLWPLFLCFLFLMVFSQAISAEEGASEEVPDRYGAAATIGYNYDPSENIVFGLISGFALYDYDKIWPHAAPEALRFKVNSVLERR